MHRVLVVCGAGASSTFLAHRIRAAARVRDIDLHVAASSTDGLAERIREIDVLLVGPPLAARFDELSRLAAAAGARSALLPDTVFGARGEEAALDLALGLDAPTTPAS
ncbi:PTS sugar transporter subunit IIB [Agreia sp.]|uniref:PTS sugar transporter subunit IIB n=1 Tax=Agreia sp. TaxID=1872416 RepID=UPI0035BC976E